MSLTERSVRDLLVAFRSPEPTPGGGSAAALTGAVGAALLAMVASLPRPRATAAADVERLGSAGREAVEHSEALSALVDRDSEAYKGVIAAYRLPKTSEEEKATRSTRIQEALATATTVPLEIMRNCAAALVQASTVAALGNPNASSDVQVAVELLNAALRGAKLNVEINLRSLTDASLVQEIRREADRLSEQTVSEDSR